MRITIAVARRSLMPAIRTRARWVTDTLLPGSSRSFPAVIAWATDAIAQARRGGTPRVDRPDSPAVPFAHSKLAGQISYG
ncbi:MAG: hypothetical protein ACREL6_11160 [Gemmatimonadales bacterium]